MPPKRKAVVLEEKVSKKEVTKMSKKESKKVSKKVVEVVEVVEDDDDDDEDDEENQPQTKKQKVKAEEGNPKSQTSKKTPTNLKDKILHLLAKQEKLIGPATIKKILKEEYDVADNKANNTRITKTLKDLSEEERDDFGKIGGSYHGGENSVAYQEYAEKRELEKLHKDDIQCPHCDTWNDMMDSWISEDSVARGSRFKCKKCKGFFYTWISDFQTEKRGHTVEYRYGDGRDDYARRR